MITAMIFNSENEDDEIDLKLMQKAKDYYMAVTEFSDEVLRPLYKWGTIDNLSVESLNKTELIEKIRAKFYEIMSVYNIEL
jgi:hypothetical protein